MSQDGYKEKNSYCRERKSTIRAIRSSFRRYSSTCDAIEGNTLSIVMENMEIEGSL